MKKIIFKIALFLLIFVPVNSEIKVISIYEGNIDAKVKLIVYESLTCGHCANFHEKVYPDLKKNFIGCFIM